VAVPLRVGFGRGGEAEAGGTGRVAGTGGRGVEHRDADNGIIIILARSFQDKDLDKIIKDLDKVLNLGNYYQLIGLTQY